MVQFFICVFCANVPGATATPCADIQCKEAKPGRTSRNVPIAIQEGDPRPPGNRRAEDVIVESCEILIAIWDGEPKRDDDDTAEIVEYALSLKRVIVWIDPQCPDPPAKLITAIRKNHKGKSVYVEAQPLPNIAAGFSPNCVQLADYNRDMAFKRTRYNNEFNRHAQKFEEQRTKAKLDSERLNPLLTQLLPHYMRADLSASTHSSMVIWSGGHCRDTNALSPHGTTMGWLRNRDAPPCH